MLMVAVGQGLFKRVALVQGLAVPLIHPYLRFKAGHAVALLENGVHLFPALCEAFDQATLSIQVETYIFRLDTAGAKILHHLKLAALRGVRNGLKSRRSAGI